MAFNKGQFEHSFAKALAAIAGAEKVTKEELRSLSRDILTAWHETGSVTYANKLLAVLSPMNKRHMVTFLTRFSGYHFDKGLHQFTKKSGKRYEKAKALYLKEMEDPHFNVWTWFDKNKEDLAPDQKPDIDFDAVGKYFVNKFNKAIHMENGEYLLLKKILSVGIHANVIAQVLQEIEFEDDVVSAEAAPL